MPDILKLLVVDDHTSFVDAIKHVLVRLADDVIVVDVNDCENALRLAEHHQDLKLVLLDINMPGMPGMVALDRFVTRFPLLPVVALTASDDVSDMQKVIDAGAMGYIHKSTQDKVLFSALRLVLAGGVYNPREFAQKSPNHNGVDTDSLSMDTRAEKLGLTPRQFDVLRYWLGGHANKVIGRQLDLTEGTVKANVSGIMKALNVEKRAQAVAALENAGFNIKSLAR